MWCVWDTLDSLVFKAHQHLFMRHSRQPLSLVLIAWVGICFSWLCFKGCGVLVTYSMIFRWLMVILKDNAKVPVSIFWPAISQQWPAEASSSRFYLSTYPHPISAFLWLSSPEWRAVGYFGKKGPRSLESPCNSPRTPLEGHDLLWNILFIWALVPQPPTQI